LLALISSACWVRSINVPALFCAVLKTGVSLTNGGFLMLHPVGSFTIFLKGAGTIGLLLLPGRAKL